VGESWLYPRMRLRQRCGAMSNGEEEVLRGLWLYWSGCWRWAVGSASIIVRSVSRHGCSVLSVASSSFLLRETNHGVDGPAVTIHLLHVNRGTHVHLSAVQALQRSSGMGLEGLAGHRVTVLVFALQMCGSRWCQQQHMQLRKVAVFAKQQQHIWLLQAGVGAPPWLQAHAHHQRLLCFGR